MRNARMIGVRGAVPLQADRLRRRVDAGPPIPELMESVQRVARVVKDEEHRYATTFQVAEKVFHDEAKSAAGGLLPGAAAFKLYDTYGLALDEQEEMARESGLTIDRDGLRRARWSSSASAPAPAGRAPRRRRSPRSIRSCSARAARSSSATRRWSRSLRRSWPSWWTSRTGAMPVAGAEVRNRPRPDAVLRRVRRPGGRHGGRSSIRKTGEPLAHVSTTYPRACPGSPCTGSHDARADRTSATLLQARVNEVAAPRDDAQPHRHAPAARRAAHRCSARTSSRPAAWWSPAACASTSPTTPRWTAEELDEVERLVNEQILRNTPVYHRSDGPRPGARHRRHGAVRREVRREGARGFGARASAGNCAAARTSAAPATSASCKIVYEGSISAGVRRIEAITGEGALQRFQETVDRCVHSVSPALRTSEPELLEQVEKLIGSAARARAAGRAAEGKGRPGRRGRSGSAGARHQGREGARRRAWTAWTAQQMRALADSLRNKWKSAVVVLAAADDGHVSIVSAVTKDLTGKGARRQAGGRGGAGRRRQGRRPPGHGRGRRQGCRGAAGARLEAVYTQRRRNAVTRVRRRGRRRGAHRPRLRHRVEASAACRPSCSIRAAWPTRSTTTRRT